VSRPGTGNTLVVAIVFSSLFVLSPAGGSATGRLEPDTAVRLGLALFVFGAVAIGFAVWLGTISAFLAAGYVAGFGIGAANAAGLRAVLAYATQEDCAGVIATLFLISYVGAAVPGLISSRLASHLTIVQITIGCLGLVLVASTVSFVVGRHSRPPMGGITPKSSVDGWL
jgi:hypothetical protein